MGTDGEVFGVLEEALAGRVLAEAVGEAGHGACQPQWTASVHMRWSAEVSRLTVPVSAARRAASVKRQAPRNVVSILDSARELGIRDAQGK